ncbi:hypothetical protein [Streptomyces sp. NPDC048106]|uniref:hypothetical protein n=1 Tax=Streptomyces sp. NPDC048106 TaxID=3155750 RepID=UPI003453B48A
MRSTTHATDCGTMAGPRTTIAALAEADLFLLMTDERGAAGDDESGGKWHAWAPYGYAAVGNGTSPS